MNVRVTGMVSFGLELGDLRFVELVDPIVSSLFEKSLPFDLEGLLEVDSVAVLDVGLDRREVALRHAAINC